MQVVITGNITIAGGDPQPCVVTGEAVPDAPPSAPSPPGWSWKYDQTYGWVLVPPGGGGKPQPLP